MIIWKVDIDGVCCVFDNFTEAYKVYKQEKRGQYYWFSSIMIYPTIIPKNNFSKLKEFEGW